MRVDATPMVIRRATKGLQASVRWPHHYGTGAAAGIAPPPEANKDPAVRSEPLFFVFVFTFSWSIWVPVTFAGDHLSALHHLAVGIGAAGPSLAGVICTAKEEGRRGVRGLFASLVRWRLAARWYALCLVGPLAVALTAVALHRLAVGDDAKFHLDMATIVLTPPFLVVGMLIGPLQEELGWRGYALPRLIDRWSSVPAALVLGVAWACWHLPLYAIDAGDQERAPLVAFLISVVALSVVYGWFWTVTSGSLLVALLLHSSTNAAGVILLRDARFDFGPSILATFLTVIVAVAAARHLRGGGRNPAKP